MSQRRLTLIPRARPSRDVGECSGGHAEERCDGVVLTREVSGVVLLQRAFDPELFEDRLDRVGAKLLARSCLAGQEDTASGPGGNSQVLNHGARVEPAGDPEQWRRRATWRGQRLDFGHDDEEALSCPHNRAGLYLPCAFELLAINESTVAGLPVAHHEALITRLDGKVLA